MGFAVNASTRGTCDRKYVGAAIILNKQVVATGYNGSVIGMQHCSGDTGHTWEPDEEDGVMWCEKCPATYNLYSNTEPPAYLPTACPGAEAVGHDVQDNHCVRTIHAEMNALAQAAKRGASVDGSTIYTTASPCWDCFRVLVNAGIKEFIFLEPYRADENAERIRKVVAATGVIVRQLPPEKKEQ